jgi:hypothetical protein
VTVKIKIQWTLDRCTSHLFTESTICHDADPASPSDLTAKACADRVHRTGTESSRCARSNPILEFGFFICLTVVWLSVAIRDDQSSSDSNDEESEAASTSPGAVLRFLRCRNGPLPVQFTPVRTHLRRGHHTVGKRPALSIRKAPTHSAVVDMTHASTSGQDEDCDPACASTAEASD